MVADIDTFRVAADERFGLQLAGWGATRYADVGPDQHAIPDPQRDCDPYIHPVPDGNGNPHQHIYFDADAYIYSLTHDYPDADNNSDVNSHIYRNIYPDTEQHEYRDDNAEFYALADVDLDINAAAFGNRYGDCDLYRNANLD